MSHRLLAATATLAVALALMTASAMAAVPIQEGYSNPQGVVQSDVNGPGSTNTGSGLAGNALPFTGLDLVLLFAGGVVLIGVGVTMSRMVNRAG